MTAPESTPKFIARLALADALDLIENQQHRGIAPVDIIAELVEHHGAVVKFIGGTNVLRCCGVAGTCTRDRSEGMLASWQRIAERRFGKFSAPVSPLASNRTLAPAHG